MVTFYEHPGRWKDRARRGPGLPFASTRLGQTSETSKSVCCSR